MPFRLGAKLYRSVPNLPSITFFPRNPPFRNPLVKSGFESAHTPKVNGALEY